MLDFCIIGSGISGSTIAHHLSKKYSVHILDKARGPGGRASNKRFKKNLSFDHGVQYISPKSKEFLKFIKTLCKKKEAKIWNGNHLDFTFEKKDISEKFIGMKGNNFISKYYTKKIKISFLSTVKKIFNNKYFWEIICLGGLISINRLFPLLRFLVDSGKNRIALEIVRIPLNLIYVKELKRLS